MSTIIIFKEVLDMIFMLLLLKVIDLYFLNISCVKAVYGAVV